MRKTLKKVLTAVLTLSMAFSSLIMLNPVSAEEATAYTIYPTPHEVVYGNDNFSISNDVNVVYGDAIDSFTRDHVVDVLNILDKTNTVGEAIDTSKTNLIVGVYNSDDYVDRYFKENTLIDSEDLFTKYDSYILSINDGVIAVLGKDTDAAFHGVTSIKHIFNQVKDNNILDLKINDYADVKGRGFIEGYYGNPWSNEDRADLMTFGGDYKLNQYIYAPKDDPKHNSNWKALYTEEELVGISKLAEAGNKSKCYYVYALHPFMYNAIRFNTDENYEADLNIIKTKLEQLMSVGVKQFAILADDAAVPSQGAQCYVRLMNDLTEWLIEKQAAVPGLKSDTIFCPNDYMGTGSSSQMQTLKQLPDSVSIIQTGGRVWGEVGPSFNDRFYQNMGRPAYMWINWPCSDNTKDGLIMGGAEAVLKPNVDPSTVEGIVLNPMQQSEPSKEALFTNADYAWNIWKEASKYDQVWHDSFNYMDHGTIEDTPASIALRELSKHMMNSQQIGNEESVELKNLMSSFISDLNTGNDITAKADELINEFTLLQNSADTYRNNPGNERTRDQIIYWLDCWQETTEAVINYLNAAKALQNEADSSVIWDYFATGQNAFDASRTHGFHYVDHTEYAKVGRRYIYPFMQNLDIILSAKVETIVNPDHQSINFITNRTDTPTGSLSNTLDNNASTEVVYKTPNSITAGTYVGISFSKAKNVDSVTFRLGHSGNLNDTFLKAKVQYTIDGKEWLDVNGEEYDLPREVNLTDLNLENVKGIRMIATADKTNTWLGVRDIVVNGQGVGESSSDKYNASVIKIARYGIYSTYTTANLIDDDDSTFTWFNQDSKVDDYVGLDLGSVLPLGKVRFVMGNSGNDYWNKYDLEYSEDGINYTVFASYSQNVEKKIVEEDLTGIKARYVRVRNTQDKGVWLKMSDFRVNKPNDTFVDTNNEDLKEIATTIETSSVSIAPVNTITLNANEYIGVILPRIRDLANIDLQLVDGDDLTLQVSKNYVDWVDVDPESTNLPDGRYVRLINKTGEAVTFDITKFEVNSNELSGPYLLDSDIGINSSWGVAEDCRDNGAAFDGKMDTITEFADLPQEGQYIIYDLGQERTINKLEMYCQDTAVNYLRDADILISNDLENWTKVITIGDGIENENDANVTCLNSDAGYKASSTYPNKVYVEGTADNVKARYIKILITATNNNRAVVFNEIVINNGEYVPVTNDPTFNASVIEKQGFAPQNMFDGNLATEYRPDTTEAGYITYTLSEKLDVTKINIIQKGNISNAKVLVLVDGENGREWVQVGTLSKSLNEVYLPFWKNIYELKFEWEADSVPVITEVIMMNSSDLLPNRNDLQSYIDGLDIVEDQYTAESYQEFVQKLADANVVLANNNSTQKELDKALTDLQDAVNNLVPVEPVETNKTALQIAVETANVLKEQGALENVVPAVVAEFEAALAEAETILADETADQLTIDASFTRLSTAIHMLEFLKGDKTALGELIAEAEKYEEGNYTTDSWANFQEALDAAKDVMNNENALEEEVVEALNNLTQGIGQLVVRADKSLLQNLYDMVNGLDTSKYIATTVEGLTAPMAEALTVLENADATQEEVDAAYEALMRAYLNLRLKPSKDLLQDLINKANGLNSANYSAKTWAVVENEVLNAKAVLENPEASEAEVKAAEIALTKALAGLEAKPVETVKPGDTTVSVKTGDDNVIGTTVALMTLSLAGYYISKKRKS
ncbi:beta-N-acetylglucosaminidase domain-containing protein [Thomasclavelia cocleata]|uniref:beta-N-acetylglucosaminidase domain-containing protein n=3 Tax=Thomasclavelia cocleata TaxID=69824 RepID=UPI002574E7BA|nr:beta-N-acetylglucosaminidase domain-containing protein [Thomasclavelia cocleata]